jgi:hypothetical protein
MIARMDVRKRSIADGTIVAKDIPPDVDVSAACKSKHAQSYQHSGVPSFLNYGQADITIKVGGCRVTLCTVLAASEAARSRTLAYLHTKRLALSSTYMAS